MAFLPERKVLWNGETLAASATPYAVIVPLVGASIATLGYTFTGSGTIGIKYKHLLPNGTYAAPGMAGTDDVLVASGTTAGTMIKPLDLIFGNVIRIELTVTGASIVMTAWLDIQ